MKSEFGIVNEKDQDGFRLVFIDTNKAKYQNISWQTMGDFGKRKFENLLVLSRAKERLKIIYN